MWKYLQDNISDYREVLVDWTWIVAGDLTLLSDAERKLLARKNLLLGPNIHFENAEIAEIVQGWDKRKVIVPSEWVREYFTSTGIEEEKNLVVWAATVNPDAWRPIENSREFILIYLKNTSKETLVENLVNHLNSINQKYSILTYGQHTTKLFKSELQRSKAAIWIGGSESQGLALLEAWFMNVPTLVLKCNVFKDAANLEFPASSAPYLDTTCGEFFSDDQNIGALFDSFSSNLDKYAPRAWALENFSHAKVLANLVDSVTINYFD